MKKTKKKFDCVEMMHRGALDIYKKTRHMTVAEEVNYWREQSRKFRKEAARKKSHETLAPA
jgi:hypothetical protein